MFGKLPKKAQEGQLVKNPYGLCSQLFKQKYDEINKTHFLPFSNNIHITELNALEKKERVAPKREPLLEEFVKNTLSKQPDRIIDPDHKWEISVCRASEVQKRRLDIFIGLGEGKIVIQPRPECKFTNFFVTYACADLDPLNYTSWNDQIVPVTDELFSKYLGDSGSLSYFDHAWCLKRKLYNHLHSMGMDSEVEEIYNSYINVYRTVLNRQRLVYLNKKYPESRANYREAITQNDKMYQKWLDTLKFRSYLNRDKSKYPEDCREKWEKEFTTSAKFQLNFDPFYLYYEDSFLTELVETTDLLKFYHDFVKKAEEFLKSLDLITEKSYMKYFEDGTSAETSAQAYNVLADKLKFTTPPEYSPASSNTKLTAKQMKNLRFDASSSAGRSPSTEKKVKYHKKKQLPCLDEINEDKESQSNDSGTNLLNIGLDDDDNMIGKRKLDSDSESQKDR